jgi:hypothetical protein
LKPLCQVSFFSLILVADALAETAHRFYAGIGVGYSRVNDSVESDPMARILAENVHGVPIDDYPFDDDDIGWSTSWGIDL